MVAKEEIQSWLRAFAADSWAAFSHIPHDLYCLLLDRGYVTEQSELTEVGRAYIEAP